MRAHLVLLLVVALLQGCNESQPGSNHDAGTDGGIDAMLDVSQDAGDAGFDWMEGQCGMEGMPVECLVSADCARIGPQWNWCNIIGLCEHDYPSIHRCANIGEPCLYDGKVCGHNYECTYQCTTHDDCPDTQFCSCYPGVNYCHLSRCHEGACSEGTHPDPGSLLCVSDVRVGDCFAYYNTCPDNYTIVAENVGPYLSRAACVADATQL